MELFSIRIQRTFQLVSTGKDRRGNSGFYYYGYYDAAYGWY